MALAPLPPPTFQPPAVRSFYAIDAERQFSPFATARYGVGSAAGAEQQVAQNVLAPKPQYQPPAAQFPQQGGASPANLQQRQFGSPSTGTPAF